MADYNGLKMELSVRNSKGVIANLYAADREAVLGIGKAMVRGSLRVQRRTAVLAPKRTKYMSQHVRRSMSPKNLYFEVGWKIEDFIKIGENFYPFFQEFGTRYLPANPSLGPAFREDEPVTQRDIAKEVRAACERRRQS
jgi:HK97 gp10 family phage protein